MSDNYNFEIDAFDRQSKAGIFVFRKRNNVQAELVLPFAYCEKFYKFFDKEEDINDIAIDCVKKLINKLRDREVLVKNALNETEEELKKLITKRMDKEQLGLFDEVKV